MKFVKGKNSFEIVLSLPKVNTTKYGLNSFRYFAAKQWNSIPNELRLRAGELECVETFTAKSTTIIEDFSILKHLKANSHMLIWIKFRQFLNTCRLSYCYSLLRNRQMLPLSEQAQ